MYNKLKNLDNKKPMDLSLCIVNDNSKWVPIIFDSLNYVVKILKNKVKVLF